MVPMNRVLSFFLGLLCGTIPPTTFFMLTLLSTSGDPGETKSFFAGLATGALALILIIVIACVKWKTSF